MDKRLYINPIVQEYIDSYMMAQGIDSQFPAQGTNTLSIPVGWKEGIKTAIKEDGYEGGVWFVKSPEAALMWPIWHQAYPNAKWVIVRRRTGDIIESCRKTAHMKAFKLIELQERVGARTESEGWLWCVHQYEQRFVEMITAGLDTKVIWPQRMVMGDFQQVHQLMTWVGLKWKSDVLGYVDKKLEKSRIKEDMI